MPKVRDKYLSPSRPPRQSPRASGSSLRDRKFPSIANVIVEPHEAREDPTDFLIMPHAELVRHLPHATADDLTMLSDMIAHGVRADYSTMVAWFLHGLNQLHGYDSFTTGFVRREPKVLVTEFGDPARGGGRWFEFVEPAETCSPEKVLELA